MPIRSLLAALLALALCPVGIQADEPDGAEVALHRRIDQRIDAALKTRKLAPAERCSDADFVRRVHLDLTGVIPDAKTTREFLASDVPDKRARLIDQLLASESYATRMATFFDVLLMERRADKYVTTPEWRSWLATAFAENRPLHQMVSEILAADGVDEQLRPAAKFYLDRAVEKDTLVRDIGRLFLGVNLQCAQCHDHPDIDDYLHRHYHGLSVFVAGSKTFRQKDGTFVLQEVVTREVEFASVFDPETTHKTGPRLMEALLHVPLLKEGEEYVEKPSRTVRSVPKFSMRALLAERLPSDQTPEFARNMANRLWAMMMGRGLVHPLDMHHADNPPSHPELLADLSAHLVDGNYDIKSFLREVALSEAYQRSSLLPPGVSPESVPVDSFAVANMKGLSPEQLFASCLVATRAAGVLDEQIDAELAEEAEEAKESTDGESPEVKLDEALIAMQREKKRSERVAEFVAVFGSVPGQPEGEFSASLPQALFLANSETVSSWVPPRSNNLAEQLVALKTSDQVAETLLLSVLSRLPTDEERQLIAEHLERSGEDRGLAIAGLIWSQLASAEFRLNH